MFIVLIQCYTNLHGVPWKKNIPFKVCLISNFRIVAKALGLSLKYLSNAHHFYDCSGICDIQMKEAYLYGKKDATYFKDC